MTLSKSRENFSGEISAPKNKYIEMISDDVCRLLVLRPKPGHSKYTEIDFSTYFLPETHFSSRPVPLSSRADLVQAILRTMDLYIARNGYTSGTHLTLRAIAINFSKLFEYFWLQGIYKIIDIRQEHFQVLPSLLAEGGWAKALDIENRTRKFISNSSEDKLREYVSVSKHGLRYSLRTTFSSAIGTNLGHIECIRARELIFEALSLVAEPNTENMRLHPSAVAGATEQTLRTYLRFINMLSDGPGDPILKFTPIKNVAKISKAGRANKRTESLRPSDVGEILKLAFWYVDKVAVVLLDVLENLVLRFTDDVRKSHQRVWTRIIKSEVEASQLPALFQKNVLPNFKYLDLNAVEISLGDITRNLLSSCFVIIAILNGRRKGEIESTIHGLTSKSLSIIDADLKIYECKFYIEKTYKDYLPFFVGDATVRAIAVLGKTSRLSFDALEKKSAHTAYVKSLRENLPLFLRPALGVRKESQKPLWFEFGTTQNKHSGGFIDEVFGQRDAPRISAHMFRRAYALVFFYRYEHGDLIALKQQLGHFAAEMTKIYVTWGAEKSLGPIFREYGNLTKSQRDALQSERKSQLVEFDAVSAERIGEFVNSVLLGNNRHTGGFLKLVQRFHQRLGRRISYEFESKSAQSKSIVESLVARGHSVLPFEHGNCVAAPSKPNNLAGCYSADAEAIKRENASAHVCGKCPYHVLSDSNVQMMREQADDLRVMLAESQVDSVNYLRSKHVLDNLERWIVLHNSRLQKAV